MDKMWAGRFKKKLDETADDFNSSIKTDCRMYREDIKGSMAHVAMLGARGIISAEDAEKISDALGGILSDIECGRLEIDYGAEDVHMFVEGELTKRLGETGKRLHTARSRNDQVALDVRMYTGEETCNIQELLKNLVKVISEKAKENTDTVMPGYTHLQRAQPITFAHHLAAYAEMFMRDFGRLADLKKRLYVLPLGSCALAGTTYPIDRGMTARTLGFYEVCSNSLDGVSDRDFLIELCSALSLVMMHLSRFSEEIILWCSWEFKFLELDDAFSTGSSIMPQKKNPDIAELVRGKCGRVYGDLMTLLTMMKGLPLAYNKDMQEDKEAVFDAIDTVKQCLSTFAPMLATAKVLKDNMLKAAGKGFINATDLADYLVKKGVAFRTAYKITGELVALCIEKGETLETLPLEIYRERCDLFGEDLYAEIDMKNCVEKRTSEGGPSAAAMKAEFVKIDKFLEENL